MTKSIEIQVSNAAMRLKNIKKKVFFQNPKILKKTEVSTRAKTRKTRSSQNPNPQNPKPENSSPEPPLYTM